MVVTAISVRKNNIGGKRTASVSVRKDFLRMRISVAYVPGIA
jgi:hypothetical protein